VVAKSDLQTTEKITNPTPNQIEKRTEAIINLLAYQSFKRSQSEATFNQAKADLEVIYEAVISCLYFAFNQAKADLEATTPTSPDYQEKKAAYEKSLQTYIASHEQALPHPSSRRIEGIARNSRPVIIIIS